MLVNFVLYIKRRDRGLSFLLELLKEILSRGFAVKK